MSPDSITLREEIRIKERAIFQLWKEQTGIGEYIRDGIVQNLDMNLPVICFLLKEWPCKQYNDLRKAIETGGVKGQTYNNIARWAYMLRCKLHAISSNPIKFGTADKEAANKKGRIENLSRCLVINCNKRGNPNKSPYRDGKYIYNDLKSRSADRELLKKQLELYNPAIIVCCGLHDIKDILCMSCSITDLKPNSPYKGINSYWWNWKNGEKKWLTCKTLCLAKYKR